MKDSTFIIGDRQFQESKVCKLISRKMGNVSKSSQCGNYEILPSTLYFRDFWKQPLKECPSKAQ